MACNLNEGVLKVTGSHVHFKSGSVLKTVPYRCWNNSPQTGSNMPYYHLIAATVMTLAVCKGHSLIASLFLYC